MMEAANRNKASDFDGYSPVHCHKPRPTRGLQDNDRSENFDMNMDIENENPGGKQVKDILHMTFEAQTCNLCLQNKKGKYLLLIINNAVQHLQTHHPGTNTNFTCSRCKKNLQVQTRCTMSPTEVPRSTGGGKRRRHL